MRKGIAASNAVIMIVTLVSILFGVVAVTGFINPFSSSLESGNFKDNAERIKTAVTDKCGLHLKSSPSNPAPRTEKFTVYQLDEISIESSGASETKLTLQSSGRTESFKTECVVRASSDLSFDSDSNPPKTYEITVSCESCGASPPVLRINKQEVD